MAGGTFIRTAAGWVEGKPYTKVGTSGWVEGATVYEKTGASTWTLRYTTDVTPPAAPTIPSGTYNTTSMSWVVTPKLPADADTAGGCLKISATGYPTNPGVQDKDSSTAVTTSDGQPFWLWTGAPNTTTTRTIGSRTAGTRYYWSFWARDTAGNWSAPLQGTFVMPYPPAPAKTLTTKTAYVNTTDSASWRSAYGWRTDNNYVYQGSEYNYQGFWFYGTAIASLLKNADSVTKMEIYIQRVNSSHGTAGAGNIMVGHHDLTAQISGSPGTNRVLGEYNIADLDRGEGKWCTINSDWYNNFQSGGYRGLGMMYSTTSTSSSYYNQCYGKGTNSGQLRITWKEYV